MASQHRFSVPAEQSAGTLAEVAGAASALFALDAHEQHHDGWLSRTSVALGLTPRREDARAKDARAKANVQREQRRALRRDLLELAADAEAVAPSGGSSVHEIVREYDAPALPDGFGPTELREVEKSYAQGMVAHMREATACLRPLRDRLRGFDDEQSGALAERIHAFIVAVHGPERA